MTILKKKKKSTKIYSANVLFISLIGVLFSSCIKTSNISNEEDIKSDVELYFSEFKRVKNTISGIDTLLLKRKIVNDSLQVMEYSFTNPHLGRGVPINPIHFIRSSWDSEIMEVYDPIGELLLRRVDIRNKVVEGLYETKLKEPNTDAQSIALISTKFGLLLSYSPSWGNYYYINGCSNAKIEADIQQVLNMYLMKKGTFLEAQLNDS